MIHDDRCWVVVALMQKHTRTKRFDLKVDSADEYIQFRVFKAKDINTYKEFKANNKLLEVKHLERVSSSGSYTNRREVTGRYLLNPGAYVIIPSTYDENRDGEFLIRIFTEEAFNPKVSCHLALTFHSVVQLK